MSISLKRYIDIVSGVGGNAAVATRQLILRLITNSLNMPPNALAEFTSAADVATFFGATSAEYLRAVFYFGWVSKAIKAPKKISFARWVDADCAPRIFGAKVTSTLTQLKTFTAATFTLSLGGVSATVGPFSLAAVTSLADVATALQTAIRAASSGTQWTGATVTYDAVNGRFTFVGGTAGAAAVSLSANSFLTAIGWGSGAILCDGAAIQTVAQTMQATVDASTNFGSFSFVPDLTQDQAVTAAAWNDTQNVSYLFLVPVDATTAPAMSAALIGYSGAWLQLAPLVAEFPELAPACILAATDYNNGRNAVQNYMFQQFPGLTPAVQSDTDANTYDALRVNYIGRTQTAGQKIDFLQRGVLCGAGTDPVDANVYANEMWLKDAIAAAVMSLFLSVGKVGPNKAGRARLLAVMQPVITTAIRNGAISTARSFTTTQRLYVGDVTGDPLAYLQVQNTGYWLDIEFTSSVNSSTGSTEWSAAYTLVYAKDDAIRSVTGSHVLV